MRHANHSTMQTETAKRLRDVLAAAEELRDIAHASTRKTERVDQLAIERLLVTVGEALNHAIQADPSVAVSVPDARLIIGLRNRIVHGYDTIRSEIIWDVARNHIDILITQVMTLLSDAPPPDS